MKKLLVLLTACFASAFGAGAKAPTLPPNFDPMKQIQGDWMSDPRDPQNSWHYRIDEDRITIVSFPDYAKGKDATNIKVLAEGLRVTSSSVQSDEASGESHHIFKGEADTCYNWQNGNLITNHQGCQFNYSVDFLPWEPKGVEMFVGFGIMRGRRPFKP